MFKFERMVYMKKEKVNVDVATINSQDTTDIIESKNEMIDVSILTEGLVVKNYKSMCSLLNCSVCEGNSKKSQLKNWKRYFNYEKSGQKFIITEIYDTPFPSEDARKLKEGLYVKYIELLLLRYLSSCEGYQTKITKSNLYQILGLTNENYYQLKSSDNPYEIANIKNTIKSKCDTVVTNFDINHFQQRAEAKLNKILYTALDSMSKRFLIKYHTEYVLRVPREDGQSGYELEIASPRQVSLILEAQHRILDAMGYENITQVALRYKLKEFNNRVDNYLNENYGWLGFFSQLSIIYINDIGREIPLKAEEIRKLAPSVQRKQLNQIVKKSLNQQAHEKYDKNQNKALDLMIEDSERRELGIKEDSAKFFQYYSTYIEAQLELADYLIDISKDSEVDKFSKMWEEFDKNRD